MTEQRNVTLSLISDSNRYTEISREKEKRSTYLALGFDYFYRR